MSTQSSNIINDYVKKGVPQNGVLFNFKEDHVFKAVLVISIITMLTVAFTVELSTLLARYNDENGPTQIKKTFDYKNLLISMTIALFTSFVAYYIIIYLFGYGESLVV